MSAKPEIFSAAPSDVLTRLKTVIPRAVLPAFEQALLKTELWLSELAAESTKNGEADKYDLDRQALQSGSARAGQRCRDKLVRAAEAMSPSANSGMSALSELTLIDDEQMEMQLAGEHLVEKLAHFHQIGLGALDQRLAKVFSQPPYGVRLVLAPQVLADAARAGLADLTLKEEFKVLAMRHFENLVDPVLSDLLKDLNAGLASAGVLPNLVIQDAEEQRRRESLKQHHAESPAPKSKDDEAAGASAGSGSGAGRAISPVDQALMADLLDMMKVAQQARRSARQAAGGLPERPMAHSETLSVLNMMQKAGSSETVLAAMARPDGSIAEAVKQEMLDNAKKFGFSSDTEAAALATEEESAVDIASNLFEVMLKDRPYADVVAPMLARMFMPFLKAAVIDPKMFLQPEHPARQLLNTVSEACEDNAGELPQEKELLSHVDKAVQKLNEEFDGNVETFEEVGQELSEQMGKHRKRVELAEKRAGETQRGQERLELARKQAEKMVSQLTSEREMPRVLSEFLSGQFKHHLSITALRGGTDDEALESAARAGKPWIDLLDLASLGEPIPTARLDSLRELTYAVLATSGIQGEAADGIFNNLVAALQIWAQEGTEEVSAAAHSLRAENMIGQNGDSAPMASDAVLTPEPAASKPAAGNAPSVLQKGDPGPPPTEEELQEIRAFGVGTWLQMPKDPEGQQQLKVSWVSPISGMMMLVNRRGARIMAITLQEMVRLKRMSALSVFQRSAPVDQAMEQMLQRLRYQKPHAVH